MNAELETLEQEIAKIYCKAKEFGLDFYDMRFEICPADILYTFGAYGMPTRFSHWSFGKAFHRMKTQYDYNLSRIYELVINSNPCYAFLLEGNSLIQNKLVMAHVFAHCDFFKNNAQFRHTSRQMVESMSIHAQRIQEYEFNYGRPRVEATLDAVLAINEHIDPYLGLRQPQHQNAKDYKVATPYDDLWELDRPRPVAEQLGPVRKTFPERPQKDLLKFIAEHAKGLDEWQRDIIAMLREEMLYFWPQIETKIMNEGWASYWHARIIRDMDLETDELIEFAKMHSGVIQTSRYHLNPYYLGLKIWEDIEKRWNSPTAGDKVKLGLMDGKGREKMFEVREMENDISFLRNYLTKELIDELDLYIYQKVGHEWRIVEKDWEKIRDTLTIKLTNCGFPVIVVQDGDYNKNGELYLKHIYEGQELDLIHLEKTLPQVHYLWNRPLHLETIVENKLVLFTFNGERSSKKFL